MHLHWQPSELWALPLSDINMWLALLADQYEREKKK